MKNAYIVNITDHNFGIGVYSENLSKYLNIPEYGIRYSKKHFFLDLAGHYVFQEYISGIAIHSSPLAYGYRGDNDIFVFHDIFPLDMDIAYRTVFSYMLKHIRNKGYRVISNSHYTADMLIKHGIKSTVIYPFVDSVTIPYKKEGIVMDSSYVEYKRPELYQEFLKYYNGKVYRIGNALTDKVYPYYDVLKMYADSRVLVNFSTKEGFGYPIAQAMIHRTIPVCSRIPVYEEILEKDYPYFIESDMNMHDIIDLVNQAYNDRVTGDYVYSIAKKKFNPEILIEKWIEILSEF